MKPSPRILLTAALPLLAALWAPLRAHAADTVDSASASAPAASPDSVSASASAQAQARSRPETLAGEDQAVPTAVPTPEGDEGGPAPVSRGAQPAPSFALPAFVIMGGGERLDLADRGDMGAGLDTSGGITTSPGEKGQGQDQRATEAVRAAPSDETYTPTPDYGELSASYGLGDSLNLDGLLAGEQGPAFGWIEGGAHNDDGGPLPGTAPEPDQHRSAYLDGEGGWRLDPDDLVEASLDGAWRALRLASEPGVAWSGRQSWGQSLGWEQDREDGLTQKVQLSAGQANLDLPSLGAGLPASYQQSTLTLDYDGERSWDWLLLDWGADLGTLEQRQDGQAAGSPVDRTVAQEGLWFEGHGEPWAGARLGLGADVNGASGGTRAFQAGPRLRFEQGLGPDLGLRLDYGTNLVFSDLDAPAFPMDGSPTVFQSDPLLPNAALKPEREPVDFKAALPWQPLAGLSLEPSAFVREDEDAFLPGASALPGLWQQAGVGTLLLEGGGLDERYDLGPWWQSAQALGQKPELPGSGLVPTFIPDWSADVAVGWRQGAFSARTGVKLIGPRQASLDGGWTIPTQVDWSLRASYDFNAWLTLFVEGDSLAGAVADWPLDTDPAPYLGLGAKLRF